MKLSLQDIRRAFPDQDFKRGMEYYRQGRVHDLKCSGEDEKLVISCRVRAARIISSVFRRSAAARCTPNAPVCVLIRWEPASIWRRP